FSSLCSFFSTPPAPRAPSPLSLHDALPISQPVDPVGVLGDEAAGGAFVAAQPLALELGQSSLDSVRVDAELGGEPANARDLGSRDRKSTRLNSSHVSISYAVFCLKKKKQQT